jgi:3-oxoacyl-[acyl-carrier protein] reductase
MREGFMAAIESAQSVTPAASRVAVITGGARGIGESVVRRFSQDRTYRAIIVDLDGKAAEALACELQEAGIAAEGHALDVSSTERIAAFFAALDERHGRCDALINNAGYARLSAFGDLSADDWNRTLAVNLTGALIMAQHAATLMERNGWGRIVNITSVSGLRAGVGRTAYGTSKAALTGLTRQMAIELATKGITVNAVAPGPVETAMADQAHSARTRDAYNQMVPMGRYATSSEVASAVAFLCSDDAAFITGHTLPVDGGYMAAGVLQW